jgi:hypothetical protein
MVQFRCIYNITEVEGRVVVIRGWMFGCGVGEILVKGYKSIGGRNRF